MKASNTLWKSLLAGKLPPQLAAEIDAYEIDLERRRQGKIDEKLFAETRLRRGVYGQRYDNGQRFDGKVTQTLRYGEASTKGPMTLWRAPGMQRIKIPFGGLNPAQLETMADLAEEYSDGIAHLTTRQDFQLHFVQLDDTPALMRRLAAVGVTTREACGNTVRNVTGCPFAGVCPDETFDVTPYARALSAFLLGHPDCQDFGRKFKPAFSGCAQHACGLVNMHDLGLVAATRPDPAGGPPQRGVRVFVGGGLGSVPHQAKALEDFAAPAELLPIAQAIARVFARLGEKKNRNRARLKFLIADLGMEKFRELVRQERAALPPDPRWTAYLAELGRGEESPLRPPGKPAGSAELAAEVAAAAPAAADREKLGLWLRTNLRPQRQEGYVVATVALPLGDITAEQLRALADIARRFTRGTVRTTVEQNFVLRWVSTADLGELFGALDSVDLAEPGAGTIVDVVACPGTDTCKLGISSSRGLAAALKRRLEERSFALEEAIRSLHIKISGCFNSCGQHHVADLGFYGVSRRVGNFKVPHFQLMLGGQWEENAGSYGLAMAAIPSKHVPEAVDRLTSRYARERRDGESFKDWVRRVGKVEIKRLLDDLSQLPPHAESPGLYSDWGDPREYSTGDIGTGECAGEVVAAIDFDLAAAERLVFEGQVQLDAGDAARAGENAYRAMLVAARGLVKLELQDAPESPAAVVAEFRRRYFDTQKFFDPFAGGKFAQYFFAAHERAGQPFTPESAHHLVEEAQLFIEAAHACYHRLGAAAKT